MAIVITKSFSAQISGTFLSFEAGQLITSDELEKELVKQNTPVAVVKLEDIIQCPHCLRAFTVEQAVAQETLSLPASESEPADEDDDED